LSLLLAREANVVLQDRHLAQQLTLDLSQAIACGAQRVQASVYGQRSVWQRVVDAAAAAVLRFGVFLTGNRY
jgi:cardiolipin synthase